MTCIVENQKEVLRNYILSPQIPIHDPDPEIFCRAPDETRLYSLPCCPASTTLIPQRDFISGNIVDFIEVPIQDAGADSNNSMSLQRAPGPLDEAVRGSTMNFPFWPGGFEEPAKEIANYNIDLDFDEDLLTIPPGFSQGIEFEKPKRVTNVSKDEEFTGMVDLLQSLENENDIKEWLQFEQKTEESAEPTVDVINDNLDDTLLESEVKSVILEISKTNIEQKQISEWAEIVDISQPVLDFAEKIPEPAFTYPFELDVFQKQAIIKLEERQYVFVAAHTSAGKTVVAEYAIALSQKHMTRTIYTSPIKALSNQKYRDFKTTFKDVGLITGDFQIDPTASCLIMTTEILRSMLFCGSDIARDLEYIIFDEVHYINDHDRGHVWEEVLILLPKHVNIIMLSATVSNTFELANWVGSTKKRKVYVISTLKRPVPLMHYLYTGCGGKSKNDIFLIVNAEGKFLMQNYEEAVLKKAETKGHAPKRPNPNTDKNLWGGLVDYLKKNNKLPVIAFTLSRNRCDNNAKALTTCDLNTGKEKAAVHLFFNRCLQKLKPPDRALPQVQSLKSSLERGIGIHHSGILPILKEIVELLFQQGLVKLLFATETFAMGVNMPAKTVIFDSHEKFDGKGQRSLKPAEYIQMAGRAGRRGHDLNGTAILICKKAVPSAEELKSIILGKPEQLTSKFLLRYAMILSLLRIEGISVEKMMSHSFKEFEASTKMPELKLKLEKLEKEKSTLKKIDEQLQIFSKFFDVAVEYIKQREFFIKNVLIQPKFINRELKPGKVIIVTQNYHYNKLAIVLSVKATAGKEPLLKVLVLDHQIPTRDDLNKDVEGEYWYKILGLLPQNKFFSPEGITGHSVLQIKLTDINEVTKTNIKVDAELILKNWNERQIERFKDNPPGASVIKAVGDLNSLNVAYIAKPDSIQYINLRQEVNLAEIDMADIEKLNELQKKLNEILPYTNIINFEQTFIDIYKIKMIEKKIEDVKYKMSLKSLQSYPEFCSKIEVLKSLKYIEDNQEVTLKGKVACEIGQNELIITELILCNILNDLNAAEIAALLSALVYQGRTSDDDGTTPVDVNEKLKLSQLELSNIEKRIQDEEQKQELITLDTDTRLNFGLVQVVYEWAQNKPFAMIMNLTQVQEGIIVRCIQQLDELLRDVKTAAMRIGNPALQCKMEEASNAIKRDIVFAESLYTAL